MTAALVWRLWIPCWLIVAAGCSTTASPDSALQCFGLDVAGDREMIRVERREERVTGTYGWFPRQKDARWGRFDGLMVGDVMEARLEAQGEGRLSSDPLHARIGDGRITIRSWELVEKQQELYVVPWDALRSLPAIPCDDPMFAALE